MKIKQKTLQAVQTFINPQEPLSFAVNMGIARTGFELKQGDRFLIISWNDLTLDPNKDAKHEFGANVKDMRNELIKTIDSVTLNYIETTEARLNQWIY
jgi:hypothetical protein